MHVEISEADPGTDQSRRHRSRVDADVALECAVCSEDDGDDGLECAICFETAAPSAKELSSRATDDASSPPPRRGDRL